MHLYKTGNYIIAILEGLTVQLEYLDHLAVLMHSSTLINIRINDADLLY